MHTQQSGNEDSQLADLALREFNHRIANSLALLIAGIRIDFRDVEAPNLRKALRQHEQRILNIGELHRLLGASPPEYDLSIAVHFEPLCAALARSVLIPKNLGCEVFLSEGTLPGASCAKLGLVICELVINAAKHAFPDGRDGLVRIEVVREGGLCRCIIADNGVGLGTLAGGSGAQIVDLLVKDLDGLMQTDSGPRGTQIAVTFRIG